MICFVVVLAITLAVYLVGRAFRRPLTVMAGRVLDRFSFSVLGVTRRWTESDESFRARIMARLLGPFGGTRGDIERVMYEAPGVRGVRIENAPGVVRIVVRVAWWRRNKTVLRMARAVMSKHAPIGVRYDVEAA